MDASELEILKLAEGVADSIWHAIIKWDSFAKDTMGKQLTKSADSMGANIAEAFGRFHFADKTRFFYYSRGSIFETKYWLNRSLNRGLLVKNDVETYLSQLTLLAKRLNSIITKSQGSKSGSNAIKEQSVSYLPEEIQGLFSSLDLEYLSTLDS